MDNQIFEHVGSLFVFASGHRVVLSSVGCFMYTDSLFMSGYTENSLFIREFLDEAT